MAGKQNRNISVKQNKVKDIKQVRQQTDKRKEKQETVLKIKQLLLKTNNSKMKEEYQHLQNL
jgi:hypothetical protein